MAKQKNIFKMQGTIGDATFYKTKDGHLVREKGGVDANRIKTDPAFQRTRENNTEFGYSGKAGQLLRNAFNTVVKQASDRLVCSRLLKLIRETVKTDTTSVRGQRNLTDADITQLEGFDFNVVAKLKTVFSGIYRTTVDRVTGVAKIEIDAFIPEKQVTFPVGATHCKMVAAIAAIDFANGTYDMGNAEGINIPLDNNYTEEISLPVTLAPTPTLPIFFLLGIEFYQELNGSPYLLRNGGFNAVQLIKVNG
jgi:hypothetical protein